MCFVCLIFHQANEQTGDLGRTKNSKYVWVFFQYYDIDALNLNSFWLRHIAGAIPFTCLQLNTVIQ